MMRRPAAVPLDRDMTGRFLPYIMAILILLASLMLTASVMVRNSMNIWQGDLAGKVTVQVMPLDERNPSLADRVTTALEALDADAAVAAAEPLPEEKMTELLKPWLGEGALPEDIPVPALIDVTLKPGHSAAHLAGVLKGVAGVEIDDHGSWFGNIRHLAQMLAGTAYVLVLLIVGAAVLIMVLLVRAAMTMHRDVVELLHLVGATDMFIARQFQRHMVRVAGLGALLGLLASALIVWGMASLAGLLAQVPWWVLPVMPFVFVVLAAYTSRHVARRLLEELT